MPIRRFLKWVGRIFGRKKKFRLAIYGSPNAGKTSLANRISLEWTGKEMGTVSDIPHETRFVKRIKEINIIVGDKEITIDLFDVPGISYKKDLTDQHYKTFLKHMSEAEATQRVREAIRGVKSAVKILDLVDTALLVMDSADDPYNPVNTLILGALESRNIPVIIVANKTDLAEADAKLIKTVYTDYPIVELSTKKDKTLEPLYEAIAKHHK